MLKRRKKRECSLNAELLYHRYLITTRKGAILRMYLSKEGVDIEVAQQEKGESFSFLRLLMISVYRIRPSSYGFRSLHCNKAVSRIKYSQS